MSSPAVAGMPRRLPDPREPLRKTFSRWLPRRRFRSTPALRQPHPDGFVSRAAPDPSKSAGRTPGSPQRHAGHQRSEEHTSELQSRLHLVCRLLLEKKKITTNTLHWGETNKDLNLFLLDTLYCTELATHYRLHTDRRLSEFPLDSNHSIRL